MAEVIQIICLALMAVGLWSSIVTVRMLRNEVNALRRKVRSLENALREHVNG